MATNTTNYNWTKPDYEDDADIKDLNDNFDGIDAQVKAIDDQVQLNKNNILSLTPNYKGKRHTFAAADTWEEEEDLEFVLPAAKSAVIHVCFRYNNVAPRGIGITRTDMATPTMILEKRECTEDFGFFSTTCFIANTTGADMTIHFFAKSKAAGGSDVYRIYTLY